MVFIFNNWKLRKNSYFWLRCSEKTLGELIMKTKSFLFHFNFSSKFLGINQTLPHGSTAGTLLAPSWNEVLFSPWFGFTSHFDNYICWHPYQNSRWKTSYCRLMHKDESAQSLDSQNSNSIPSHTFSPGGPSSPVIWLYLLQKDIQTLVLGIYKYTQTRTKPKMSNKTQKYDSN